MVDQTCCGGNLTGIKQIVRLKGMLKKWQTVTFGSRPTTTTTTTHDSQENHHGRRHEGVVSRPNNNTCCDSDDDEESCCSPEPAPDVPKGYLAVYVGGELRRFIIPTSHLSHPVFKILLEKAEEEFGYDINGALTIPCEIEIFKRLLICIENQTKKGHNVGGSQVSEHALICV